MDKACEELDRDGLCKLTLIYLVYISLRYFITFSLFQLTLVYAPIFEYNFLFHLLEIYLF